MTYDATQEFGKTIPIQTQTQASARNNKNQRIY